MARASISYINSQFENYANWYLKAYETFTTNPKEMYDDPVGGTAFAKLQLDVDGFIITTGGTKIIPYIDGLYDLWLFPTEEEADEDDTSNAIRMARFISAETNRTDPVAEEGESGTVQLATTPEVETYTQQRFNSDPITPINDDKVTNAVTTYDMINEYFTLAGGGGDSLEIGDTILRDSSIGDADDNFLRQDGKPFDNVTYPLLAANPDYQKGKSIDTFNGVTENSFLLNISTTAIYVRVSSSLYFAFVAKAGNDEVYKSTDGGVSWTFVLNGPFAAAVNAFSAATFDGTDKVLVFHSGNVAVFDTTTESYVTGVSNLPAVVNPQILHWNSNLNKWVVFAIDTSPFITYIYSSPDGITWTEEYKNPDNADVYIDDRTYGIGSSQNSSYYNGKYYINRDRVGEIYAIPEDDLHVRSEYLVDSYTKSMGDKTDALATSIERPIITINEFGQMATLISYTSATDGQITVKIRYSEGGNYWEDRFISITESDFVSGSNFIISQVVAIAKDTFLISSGSASTSNETGAGFIITNNGFTTDSFFIYTATNPVASYFYKTLNLIYEPTNGNIIINLPSGNTAGADCRNMIVDTTTSVSDVFETKDLKHLNNGNLVAYVKGK